MVTQLQITADTDETKVKAEAMTLLTWLYTISVQAITMRHLMCLIPYLQKQQNGTITAPMQTFISETELLLLSMHVLLLIWSRQIIATNSFLSVSKTAEELTKVKAQPMFSLAFRVAGAGGTVL